MPLINKVKQFCDRNGITPYRLHKQVGLSKRIAYELYNDAKKKPSINTIERICDAYFCEVADIIESVSWDEYLDLDE